MANVENIKIVLQFFVVVIAMIGLAIGWHVIFNDSALTDVFQQTDVGSNARQRVNNFYIGLDTLFIFIYVAIHLGVLIMAYFGREHPIMYILTIFILLSLVLISPILSNTYTEIMASQGFNLVSDQYSKTDALFSKLPLWETIWGIASAVVMFGLARSEGLI